MTTPVLSVYLNAYLHISVYNVIKYEKMKIIKRFGFSGQNNI